jgi:hypothetical protein
MVEPEVDTCPGSAVHSEYLAPSLSSSLDDSAPLSVV